MPQDMTNPNAKALSIYRNVAALLGLLLIATIVARWMPLGRLNLIVALAIACAKATLVAVYFMHLRQASRVNRVFATVGILWLAILIALTLVDYAQRG